MSVSLYIVTTLTRNLYCILLIFALFFITTVSGGFACLEDPCVHGICIDDLNRPQYQCYCQNGFTGYSCEQNWDECRSWGPSPCRNGGTCLDGIASFNCSCPDPFAGRLCEVNLANCGEVFPCQNNGTCAYSPESTHEAGLMCSCPPGFTGVHCEEDVSICNTTTNVCLNGGKCVDGIGKRYSCSCMVGWEGYHCELPVDECASSPCQNGGICVDKIADFSCACPFGFTGKACETKLDICDENPCLNGAFCLQESNKRVCYCVPDFHGELCENQYDECEPRDKCSNGGTCIDGVGTFTCSCPPGFFGKTCQCTRENQDSAECLEWIAGMNRTTTTTSTEAPSSTEEPEEPCDEECSSSTWIGPASATRFLPGGHTPYPPLDSSAVISSGSPYDPGGLSSAVFESRASVTLVGAELTRTLPPPTEGVRPTPTLTVITTFVEETADVGSTESYEPCPTLSVDESGIFNPEVPLTTTTAGELMSSSLSISSKYLGPSIIIPSMEISPLEVLSPSLSSAVSSPTWSRDPNELITEFPPGLFTPTQVSPTMSTASFGTELWEIPDSSSVLYFYSSSLIEMSTAGGLESSPMILYPSESVVQVESPSTTAVPPFITPSAGSSSSLLLSGSMGESRFGSLSVESSPVPGEGVLTRVPPLEMTASLDAISRTTSTTAAASSELLTIVPSMTVPAETLIPTVSLSEAGIITALSPTFGVEPTPGTPSLTVEPSPATSAVVVEPTAIPTPIPPLTTTTTSFPNLTDPCENYCHNNAKCISTTIEPICICPFKFTGVRCEREQEPVLIPSFSGNSFVKYVLPRASANIIDISSQMATVVPEGILMYSAIGQIYALIYIQNGLVTLHFSCGAQSMHFVETRTRVDNGYNFTLSFRLENTIQADGELRCIGQVSLNESYSMRGEQIVDRQTLSALEQPMKLIFLGGLDDPDAYSNDDIIRISPGFRGCVYHLRVNQEYVSMFDEAKDGREISECSTFGCVVNPCSENSRCVSSVRYPFWQCLCPSGYVGTRCNIRACSVDPCENGATCTTVEEHTGKTPSSSPSWSGGRAHNNQSTTASYKCLCTLGFTGNLCQSQVNITKPSFHGNPDYSSFLAYDPVPRFADWMQLKFHFITHNMSQIALLMFSGSETENIKISRQQLESMSYEVQQQQQQQDSNSGGTSISDSNNIAIASDFFAISFLQGFIALTWNLGSGTQRITTPSRIDNRLNVHTLFAGRHGRQAWLKVDGMRNITGKSPGPLYRLNVHSDLYVGGHEIPRFDGLPHDIPLHTGFQGCVFDLGFRIKNKLYLPRPLRGRSVGNCYEEDC